MTQTPDTTQWNAISDSLDTTANHADATVGLTEAFHAVYDVKDAAPTESARYAAYEALQAIEKLMKLMAVQVPTRFDHDGRPS